MLEVRQHAYSSAYIHTRAQSTQAHTPCHSARPTARTCVVCGVWCAHSVFGLCECVCVPMELWCLTLECCCVHVCTCVCLRLRLRLSIIDLYITG